MAGELFYDNLDVVSNEPLVVRARIAVLATKDGGRSSAFTKGYRPNHNFGSSENRSFLIGQIEVPEGEWIQPGETREVFVRFLNVRGLAQELNAGRNWRIQEGSKLVATAEVLSVE